MVWVKTKSRLRGSTETWPWSDQGMDGWVNVGEWHGRFEAPPRSRDAAKGSTAEPGHQMPMQNVRWPRYRNLGWVCGGKSTTCAMWPCQQQVPWHWPSIAQKIDGATPPSSPGTSMRDQQEGMSLRMASTHLRNTGFVEHDELEAMASNSHHDAERLCTTQPVYC